MWWPFNISKKRRKILAKEKRAEIDVRRALRHNYFSRIPQLVAQGIIHPDEAVQYLNSVTASEIIEKRKSKESIKRLADINGGDKAAQVELLGHIPGVTHEIAYDLMDQFQSLENISKASIEELDAVHGIGPKKALAILTSIDGIIQQF